MAYNFAHNITPQGVQKRIKDIIEGMYEPDVARSQLKAAQEQAKYLATSPQSVSKEMLQAAKNLEFEKATELCDQLKKLRESVLISPL